MLFFDLFGGGGGESEAQKESRRQREKIERQHKIAQDTMELSRAAQGARRKYLRRIGKAQRRKKMRRKVA